MARNDSFPNNFPEKQCSTIISVPFLLHFVHLSWADGFPWLLHWLSRQIQDICSDVTPLCLWSCHTGDSGRHPSGDLSSISPWHLQHRGSDSTAEPGPVASVPAVLKVCLIQVMHGCKIELTRLKTKLNQLKVKDASGMFYHTLLFDMYQTRVILTADFWTDTRTNLNLFYYILQQIQRMRVR